VVQVSLWWDLYQVREQVGDLLQRVECLRECSVQERGLVPEWVFPLERVLGQVLEQVPEQAQVLGQDQVRPQVSEVLVRDPQHQEVV
jgi:hypothetical protein